MSRLFEKLRNPERRTSRDATASIDAATSNAITFCKDQSGIKEKIYKSKADRLIYISCNPVSMLRDIKALTANHRFILRSITGYDMYCLSSHMEAVAILDTE